MKKILITGATSGIGLAIARQSALKGHYLILGCRNVEKAERIKDELFASGASKVTVRRVDLADLESIKAFTEDICSEFESIDILVNNAGVFSDTKQFTKDGFERAIGTNFIGHVALTEGLLPIVQAGDEPRIVNIASKAALFGKIRVDDSFFEKPAKGFPAYAKSKSAQVLYTIHLSDRLLGSEVIVNAVHPGEVATNIWRGDSLIMKIVGPINRRRLMSADEAAKVCMDVMFNERYGAVSGQLIDRNGFMKLNRTLENKVLGEELMKLVFDRLKRSVKQSPESS